MDPTLHTDADSIIRRHHYVPRLLLARFARSTPKGEMLFVFDRQRSKPSYRSTGGTGWALDFYGVITAAGPPDTIEKYLSKAEGRAAPVIREMLDRQALPTGRDLEFLLRFVGLMHTRTPLMRNRLRDHIEGVEALRLQMAVRTPKFLEHYYATTPKELQMTREELETHADSAPRKLTDASVNALAAQMAVTGMGEDTMRLLRHRTWSLVFATQDGPDFILGDSPVSIWFVGGDAARQARADGIPAALDCSNTEVVMPLSSRAAIVGRMNNNPAVIGQLSSRDVTIMNGRTVNSAQRFLYARDNDFEFWDLQNKVRRSNSWLGTETPTSDPV